MRGSHDSAQVIFLQKHIRHFHLHIYSGADNDGKTELGIPELVALTAGPVIVFCIIFITAFLLYHRHQMKKRPPMTQLVEPNPIDTPLLPDGQPSTLTELMFDYSGSGSGNLYL